MMQRLLLTTLTLLLLASPALGAQLVLITDKTKRPVNEIGDVVAILPDSHQFSPTELALFKIVRVKGTPEEVQRTLEDKAEKDEALKSFEQVTKYRYRVTVDSKDNVTINLKSTTIESTVSK